ncbi:MAG: dihydrofolate reductase family protein [Proteobacteria bacterium]|nr:dihydrofolate reductase family protein [Pseudomonadota bacterium]
MKIILSCAMSADGYLDDSSPRRLILSSPEDLAEIQKLRASCDAILVGAETVRKDNPSLCTRDEQARQERIDRGLPPDPVKVVLTSSGDMDPSSRFFMKGNGKKIVYHTKKKNNLLLPQATPVHVDSLIGLIADLENRNMGRLLVEGGARTLTQFLEAGLFDEARVAVAPIKLGSKGAAHLPLQDFKDRLKLRKTERHGETDVFWYNPADKALLARATELAFLCPPTDRAYCVGALIASKDGAVLSTGYSREWEGNWHAEEIAIEKARRAGTDLTGAAIYSSMEPCHPRLSGKKSCTEHIADSDIARVIFCLKEPLHFVQCRGEERLRAAGLEVFHDLSSAPRARTANAAFFP